MRLQLLDLATRDLIEGFHFYEDKEKGLGDYFLVNLYSDIESLKLFAGTHRKSLPRYSTWLFRNDSHSRFIIPSKRILSGSEPWWIAAKGRHGFDGTLKAPDHACRDLSKGYYKMLCRMFDGRWTAGAENNPKFLL